MVIIILGLPGSGKSYFATKFAAFLHAEYAGTDELRQQLFSQRTYTDAEKLVIYDQMLHRMNQAIADKKTIILDGTFYKTAIRDRFEQAAKRYGEKIHYIEVTAPEKVIAERLKKPRELSEADFEIYLKLKKEFEPLTLNHLVLDSASDNIDQMLHKAKTYVYPRE